MGREFVDEDRKVMNAYYELHEKIDAGITEDKVKKELQKLIKKDPYFFDTYIMLFDLLEEDGYAEVAEQLLNDGYKKAIELITDKQGDWPDELQWGFLENRHVIRIILNYGMLLWKRKKNKDAIEIFRKLLNSNPNDNIGVRNYILAIRERMTFHAYEKRFNRGGYYDMASFEWFEQTSVKYPEEFEVLPKE